MRMDTSKNNMGISCNICNKSFTAKANLKRHNKTFHTNAVLVHCDICNKGFPSEIQMVEHRRTHITQVHAEPELKEEFEDSVEEVSEQIYCQYCEKPFTDFEAWKEHEEEESRNFAGNISNTTIKQEFDSSNVKYEFSENVAYSYPGFDNVNPYSQLESGNIQNESGAYSLAEAQGQVLQNYVQQDSQIAQIYADGRFISEQYSINGFPLGSEQNPIPNSFQPMEQNVYSGIDPQFNVNYIVTDVQNPNQIEEAAPCTISQSQTLYQQDVKNISGLSENLIGNYAMPEVNYQQLPVVDPGPNLYTGIAEDLGPQMQYDDGIKQELTERSLILETNSIINSETVDHDKSNHQSEADTSNSETVDHDKSNPHSESDTSSNSETVDHYKSIHKPETDTKVEKSSGKGRRKSEKTNILLKYFYQNSNPSLEERKRLADELKFSLARITTWFRTEKLKLSQPKVEEKNKGKTKKNKLNKEKLDASSSIIPTTTEKVDPSELKKTKNEESDMEIGDSSWCEICEAEYIPGSKDDHSQCNSNNKIECTVCAAVFLSIDNLNGHMIQKHLSGKTDSLSKTKKVLKKEKVKADKKKITTSKNSKKKFQEKEKNFISKNKKRKLLDDLKKPSSSLPEEKSRYPKSESYSETFQSRFEILKKFSQEVLSNYKTITSGLNYLVTPEDIVFGKVSRYNDLTKKLDHILLKYEHDLLFINEVTDIRQDPLNSLNHNVKTVDSSTGKSSLVIGNNNNDLGKTNAIENPNKTLDDQSMNTEDKLINETTSKMEDSPPEIGNHMDDSNADSGDMDTKQGMEDISMDIETETEPPKEDEMIPNEIISPVTLKKEDNEANEQMDIDLKSDQNNEVINNISEQFEEYIKTETEEFEENLTTSNTPIKSEIEDLKEDEVNTNEFSNNVAENYSNEDHDTIAEQSEEEFEDDEENNSEVKKEDESNCYTEQTIKDDGNKITLGLKNSNEEQFKGPLPNEADVNDENVRENSGIVDDIAPTNLEIFNKIVPNNSQHSKFDLDVLAAIEEIECGIKVKVVSEKYKIPMFVLIKHHKMKKLGIANSQKSLETLNESLKENIQKNNETNVENSNNENNINKTDYISKDNIQKISEHSQATLEKLEQFNSTVEVRSETNDDKVIDPTSKNANKKKVNSENLESAKNAVIDGISVVEASKMYDILPRTLYNSLKKSGLILPNGMIDKKKRRK